MSATIVRLAVLGIGVMLVGAAVGQGGGDDVLIQLIGRIEEWPDLGGALSGEIGPNTLVVYTTLYDDEPPAPVSGITVDDRGDGMAIRWDANPADDLCYYRVYAAAGREPALSVEDQVGSTIATQLKWAPAGGGEVQARVLAVDSSGNPSEVK